MSRIPISVCIIAKNEEKYLEECLKRIKPYGFEIIVTDTGSTDRTKEIAEKYADKVLDFEWINDFSAARNYCAQHASNHWILCLDCDEYVEKIDVGVLRILMQKMPKAAGNLRLKILVYDSHDELQYTTEDVTRFYNRNYYSFVGAIHEQITPFVWEHDDNGQEILKSFMLPMDVVHQGYAQSKEIILEKQKRNLEILKAAIEKEPEDPYLYFQYGQSLYITGQKEEAICNYEKALSLSPSVQFVYVQAIIMGLAKGYFEIGRREDAIALLKQYESSCHTAKFAFLQGSIYMDCGQLLKAVLYFVKATTMPDVDTLGVNLAHCYENIIKIHNDLGNKEMATLFRQKYESCLAEKQRVLSTANDYESANAKIC